MKDIWEVKDDIDRQMERMMVALKEQAALLDATRRDFRDEMKRLNRDVAALGHAVEGLDREHDLLAARLRFDSDLPQPIRRNGRRVAAG